MELGMLKSVLSAASAGRSQDPHPPARRNAAAQTCVLLCERHLADAMSGHGALPQIIDRAARAAGRPTSFGPPMKHEIGEHHLAGIVHLATTRVAQVGNGNLRAVLGYQAGFIEQPLATAFGALDVHRCAGIVGECELIRIASIYPG